MRRVAFAPAVAALALASSPSLAHNRLDTPTRRYDDMKGAPCGRGDGADGRTANVTTFAPGEAIEVVWTETINHAGKFRVSFDPDGGDEADFNDADNILLVQDDSASTSGEYRATVTLPDIECGNCTLQVVQTMSSSDTPVDGRSYFQCADLVLGGASSSPPEVDGGSSADAPGGGCSATGASPSTLLLAFASSLAALRASAARRIRRRR